MPRANAAITIAGELPRLRSLSFTVYGPPVPKARARKGRGGHWHTPKATREYERAVAWMARGAVVVASHATAVPWPLDALYRVECAIYMSTARRADSDNIVKSVLDAGNELLWNDDSQVIETATIKRIDREAPRVDVRVHVLGEPQP